MYVALSGLVVLKPVPEDRGFSPETGNKLGSGQSETHVYNSALITVSPTTEDVALALKGRYTTAQGNAASSREALGEGMHTNREALKGRHMKLTACQTGDETEKQHMGLIVFYIVPHITSRIHGAATVRRES